MIKNIKQRAFTLIELLVVIAIIGILASLIIVSLSGARSKATDTQRKNNARNLDSALAQYYTDNNNVYPVANAAAGTSIGTSSACATELAVLVGTNAYLTAHTACGDPAATPLAHLYRSPTGGAEYAIGWQLAAQNTQSVATSGNGVYRTAADGSLTVPNTADFDLNSAFPDALTYVFVTYGPQ